MKETPLCDQYPVDEVGCVIVTGKLGDYATGHVDLTERLRVAGHLTKCPACSATLAQIKGS